MDIGSFDFLDPRLLPPSEFELEQYGRASIVSLAEMYGMTFGDLWGEWQNVMNRLVRDPDFGQLKTTASTTFWPHYLMKEDVPWGQNIKKIVQRALLMPASSAQAERGFSVLKHIKYDRRSQLSLASMNAFMRIQVNGPPPQEFAAYRYAKLWFSEGHILSDSTREFANPKSNMNKQEQELETGTQYVFENDDAGKNLGIKSNLF